MNLIFLSAVFLIAHILSDFYLQPTKWVDEKNSKGFRAAQLYWHCIIYALTVSVAVFCFTQLLWLAAVAFFGVGLLHIATDGLKKRFNDGMSYFIIDQAIHVIVLSIVVWLVYTRQSNMPAVLWIKATLVLLGYMIVLKPFGITAKKIMDTFGFSPSENGLKNGGLWIGYIERFLIFTFILMSYYEGIGFLLAAKSIFRFGELKSDTEIKRTEYILIGTLLSFGLAVCTGMLIKVVLNYL